MKDHYGRSVNYLRLSLTDRCNLRCRYCMPDGIDCLRHSDILTYEELLRIAEAATRLGITNFKVTGGEPLVRKGCIDFIRSLKQLPNVNTVTLTTNGILLHKHLDALRECGIDAINISLDTTDPQQYERITKYDGFQTVKESILASAASGMTTKLNCVLLQDTKEQIPQLAHFARTHPIDVRFIELMPIGIGALGGGISQTEARSILLRYYPDLHDAARIDASSRIGNGPARYEISQQLVGRIGWIDAMSHKFCQSCNRIRLTSDGMLKPCLCFGDRIDIRKALRSGCTDQELLTILKYAIEQKPMSHCFEQREYISEARTMTEIGG